MRKHKSIFCMIAAAIAAICMGALSACGDPPAVAKPASIFSIDKPHVELTADGSMEVLTLTIANVKEAPVWQSSNDKVAAVSVGSSANKATVKPISKGYCTVYATAGENIAVCTVKVNSAVKLDLITPSLEIMSGRTARIEVETDAPSVTYRSNNTSIAQVNSDGLVSAISGGTTTITVSGGGKSAVCNVTVIEPAVSLDKSTVLLTLEEGSNTCKLTATTNGVVSWRSTDPEIATVEDGLITALKTGETTVVASYESAEAKCAVKVKERILTVELSETSHTLPLGESFKLVATLSPEQQGDDAEIDWSVVDGDTIVTVDQDGNVTANGGRYGEATVRASSAKDADFYTDCKVTVPDPYGDWLAISDRASFEAALKMGNENKNMYLTCDIDLEGSVIVSNMGTYNGTIEGRGYKISNFTTNGLFAGMSAASKITRLAIECSAENVGSSEGIFGLYMLGKIEDCLLDVTFGSTPNTSVFGRNGGAGAIIKNTVVFARNPKNTPNTYAGFVQGAGATTISGTYYAAYGALISNGITLKTDAQLRSASLYAGYDKEVWIIEDGELPALMNENNKDRVRVLLDKSELTTYVGDGVQLVAHVKPDTLIEQQKKVVWSSSDTSIATVDGGAVTPIKVGKVTITAALESNPSIKATCEITVESATQITVPSSAVSLEIDDSRSISATVNRGKLTYESDDETVATVTSNGKITAVAAGTAVITVRSTASPQKFVTVTVTVLPNPELTLNGDDSISLEIGDEFTASVTSNRKDDTLVWSSSDGTIVAVDNDGKMTGVKAGSAVVTCRSSLDDNKSVEIAVTVEPEVQIEIADRFTIKLGLDTPLGAYVNRGGLTYTSSDDSVVTVSPDGVLNGKKEGVARITMTSDIDNTKTAVCEITVQTEVVVSVTLNKTDVKLDHGESVTLIARANVPGVVWSSSDETVVSVTQDGKVTAMKKDGVATITATSTTDETASATCTVTVEYVDPIITLIHPIEGVELEIGGTVQVQYTVSKGGADIVIASGTGALSLDGNTLTAVRAGTVTVKVVSDEKSGIFETFTVTVLKAPVVEITNAGDVESGFFVGEGTTLEISVNRTDGKVEWASSDESVLTVSDGVITTHKSGTVTVSATFTSELGATATASVQITVRDHASIAFALDARSVRRGGTYKPQIDVKGGTATYTSQDTSIATVGSDGTIRGVAIGKTVITATVGGVSDTIIIDVYQNNGEREISTAAELKNLSGNSVLVNDIDFAGVEITSTYITAQFFGTLDGRGYSLKNITTNFSATEQGFFNMLNGAAELKNINFVDFVLGGSSAFMHGGLIRQMDGNSTVKNCYFNGTIAARGTYVGAIGSKFGLGTIENCLFDVTIQNAASSGTSNPRLAIARWFNGDVKNCYVVKTANAFAAGNGDNNAEKYAAALKTVEQLKDASIYDTSWNESWVIEDGKLPVLKSAYVDE